MGPSNRGRCWRWPCRAGADSLATALLARDWARGRGGETLALVVDHGLRQSSASEAELTLRRLAAMGIAAELLRLADLSHGPGLAERARAARHAALEAACAGRGILHLVFGHHAGDQAETLCMRLLARSGPAGLAGMAALAETPRLRRLRPLLAIPPARLRATLRHASIGWVEDPSNHDPGQQRARLRRLRCDPCGTGPATTALVAASAARGLARAAGEAAVARALAQSVRLSPYGFAVWDGPLSPEALAALLGMLSGAARPPSVAQVAGLALRPRACTMAGIRLAQAGRLGPGLLLAREAAAMAPPVAAVAGALWDGRFRLEADWPDHTLGAWGEDVPPGRDALPQLVRRTLPVLRRDGRVVATLETMAGAGRHAPAFTPRLSMTNAGFFPLLPFS